VAKITAKAGQILAQEPWSGGAGELRDAGGAALNAPWGLMHIQRAFHELISTPLTLPNLTLKPNARRSCSTSPSTQPSHQTPHRIKVSVSMVVGQPGSEVTVMPGRWGRVGGNFRWEGLPLLWGSLVSFQFQLSGSSAQQQHTRALGDF